jgi:K+-transporting ATPase ATPase C chain
MIKELRPAIVMLIAFTVLTGLIYPLGMTGLSQLLFPWQANGSLLTRNGQIIGSALIGQNFTSPKYFHGRPSVTTDTDAHGKTIPAPYNAANSYASNLGPTSKALIDRIKGDVKTLKAENNQPIPVDLVTSSASGLDPDVTPAGALFQVPRVAKARGLSEDVVRKLVDEHTEGRFLGIFGEPHVNVLKLNLALDEVQAPGQ